MLFPARYERALALSKNAQALLSNSSSEWQFIHTSDVNSDDDGECSLILASQFRFGSHLYLHFGGNFSTAQYRDALLKVFANDPSIVDKCSKFAAVDSRMVPVLLEVLESLLGCVVLRNTAWVTWLAPAVPPSIDVPEGYVITDASDKEAQKINDCWSLKNDTSLRVITDCIRSMPSSCAFFQGDEPVAWALTRSDGSIGVVYVDEKHRRKRLGSGVVSRICAGAVSYISSENKPSIAFHTRLGYRKTGMIHHWIITMPGALKLTSGYIMRPFQSTDVDFMVSVFSHNLWEQWTDPNDRKYVEPFVNGSCEAFKDTLEIFKRPGIFYLVLNDSGERAGMCGLQDLGDGRCELKRMHLLPKARGQGIGKAVVHRIVKYAKQRKFKVVEVSTLETLPVAIRLYTSSGFKATGKWTSAHGTSVKELCFELIL